MRSCGLPDVTSAALAGSESTIFTSGRASRMTAPVPANVPPVPYPITK
jgi:hypothetical protein